MPMTAKQALDTANATKPGERLHRYETICAQRGSCEPEHLENDRGRWTWCPDCLTLYDDYGKAVNRVPEMQQKTCAPTRVFVYCATHGYRVD